MKKTTLSLQEQLLKSGLTNDNKAKQVKTEKRKQAKIQRNNGVEIVDEIKLSAEQSRLQQAERDRELNRQRQQQENAKALAAQIAQLTTLNRIAQAADGISYQFNHHNKVKTLNVSEAIRQALIEGRVGVIGLENRYEIVPAEIARRIQQRDADAVVLLNSPSQNNAPDDDPYAAYQIPDDLIW